MATVVAVHSFGGGTDRSDTTANVAAIVARSGDRVNDFWGEAWVHRASLDGDSHRVPATVTHDGFTIRISPTHA